MQYEKKFLKENLIIIMKFKNMKILNHNSPRIDNKFGVIIEY